MVDGAKRIKIEKLREHQYKEGYTRSFEGKRVKWVGENLVCGSVRMGGKNPKSVGWNDEVKAAVRRKEYAWKEVLAARDEEAKERLMEAYREEKRKIKRCTY